MKKFLTGFVLVLTVAVVALSLVGCTKPDKNEYNFDVPTKIIVGYDNHFPPMGFKDILDNTDKGFDLDLARAVGEHMGVTVELKAIDWGTKEDLLNNGTIDVIWNGYTMSKDRMKKVDFSIPYLKNVQIAVVKAGSAYQTLADLKDKKLIMQAESTAVEAYLANDNLKNNETLQFGDNVECFEALKSNKGEALVIDKVVADYLMKISYSGEFRILAEELAPEKYAVGIRRKDVGLRIAINDALIELARLGEIEKIANKWGLAELLLIK